MIDAYNKLDHNALHGNAPNEVPGDDDLRFKLRVGNAGRQTEIIQRPQARQRNLEEKGGSGRSFNPCPSNAELELRIGLLT